MATVDSAAQSLSLSSKLTVSYDASTQWYTRTSNTDSESLTFTASVPSGAVINSSTFYWTQDSITTYSGAVKVDGVEYISGSHSIEVGAVSSVTIPFSYKIRATSGNVGTNPTSSVTQTVYFSNCYLSVNYYYPYTKCAPPTSFSFSANNVAPGATSRLSWSGAAAGTGMDISKYAVYRSTSAGGTDTYLDETADAYLDVTAPTSNGSKYFYKVVTVGTVAGWNSDMSGASAGLTCEFSAPSAPTAVTVDTGFVNPGGAATLSWSGAGEGTNNDITGYDVYLATSAAGTYTKTGSAAGTSLAITAPSTQGATYFYKVLTKGTYSNSGQSSEYASLKANTQPGKPTFVFPATGAETHSLSPAIKVTVPAEPDEQLQTLEIKLNAGSWTSLGNILAAGETKTYVLAATDGTHTITVRAKDSMGLTSAETAISIAAVAPAWSRTLATGTVFASPTVSGRTDLNELTAAISKVRGFVGLAGVAPTGVGQWARWKPIVEELQTALKAAYTAGGKTTPTTDEVPTYPTASVLNQLRTLVRDA